MVLQLCHNGVRVVLQWCQNCVTVELCHDLRVTPPAGPQERSEAKSIALLGIGMVSIQYQCGVSVVDRAPWCKYGVSIVTIWFQYVGIQCKYGVSEVPVWCQYGYQYRVSTVPVWCWHGA